MTDKMPANPKQIYGLTKVPLDLLPAIAEIEWAKAQADGAKKYGPYNWHENAVETMTYIAAARRHLMAFTAREERAEDSGAHHLGHVMACCAIVMDAEARGQLIDNRPAADTVALEAMKKYHDEMSAQLAEEIKEQEKIRHELAVAAAS